MTTKLYFHNASASITGTLPSSEQSSLTADSNLFTGEDGTSNRSMNTTIGVSQANLTNASTADTSSHNYYVARWVSPLIYETNIQAKTWTYEFGAKESNAAANWPVSGTAQAIRVNCYVWKPSDGTKVGTILDGNSNADFEEAGTSQSVINGTFVGAAVTGMTPGDAVLVFEMWAVVTQANGTSRTQDVYFDGTTENSTTSEAAFISTPQDIEFTPTDGSETFSAVGGSIASTANTTQYWAVLGRPDPTTTEAESEFIIRTPGTISKMSLYLQGYSVASGTTTFTIRKNGADTTVTVGTSTSGAQLLEDLTHSFTVAAGDKICLKTVPGAATGTFTIGQLGLNFKTTDGYSCQLLGVARHSNISVNSANRYVPLQGDSTPDSTENEAKVKQKKAGRYQYFAIYVTANARTTNTVFKTRKNNGDGNISITVPAGQTGLFENTSSFDTVAVDDGYNFGITSGSGSETLTYSTIKIEFFADDYSGAIVTGNLNTATIAANLTKYLHTGGTTNSYANDVDVGKRVRITRATLSNLYVYLVANTVSADSTLTLRKNGADTAITLTITANTAGAFSDTIHSVEVGSGDDINYKIVTGATGTTLEISHIVLYYKLPRITTSKVYKYNMLSRASLSNIYKYNLIGRISLSRIYKYHLATRVSLSRIYKYHIVTRISLSRIYKWHLNARVSLNRIYKYHLLGRISLSRIYKYHLQARVSLSRIYKYHLLGRISLSRIYKYHIQARISLSRIYKYNLLGRISLSRIYKYHLLARISLSRNYLYNILGRVSLSRIYKYHVQARISLSRIYKYHIANLVSLARIYKYNIVGRVSLSRIYKYHLLGRISLARNYLWNLVGRISLPRTYKYNILGRISLPSILKYNINQRISLSAIYKYHIQARVSLSRVYKYNQLARISLARTYLWDIIEGALTRVSKPQIYKYNIQARVSLDRIYKYNILVRVSLDRVYKYHLLGRISLSRQYLYHIVGRVSVSRIYKWNLLSRISLSRIYRYHITTLVSKASIFKYNVIGRISLSKIYKYNILHRVSRARTYKWNVLQRISKSRTYVWHVANRVSKTIIYKWNILHRVSLSRIYKWTTDILRVVRPGRSIDKTESRTIGNLPFDKWRSYLHRPQETRGKRRSKYTRG